MASKSVILPIILLVLAAAGVGVFMSKSGAKEAEPAAPAPAAPKVMTEAAVEDDEPGVPEKILKFFKDVKYAGTVTPAGWTGTASYTFPAGHTAKIGTKGADGKLRGMDAALTYKAKGGLPNLDLVASTAPGAKLSSVKYAAKLTKEVKGGLKPKLSAALTNAGVVLGASATASVTDDMDIVTKLDMPFSYETGKVDPTFGADATYKVGGGKVVGSLVAKSSGGIKGSQVTASYDLR